MKIPERITQEYLNSLPKIQINPTSDLMCFARYDQEAEILFMLDSDGNFSGKVAPADNVVKINDAEENETKLENSDETEEPEDKTTLEETDPEEDPFAEKDDTEEAIKAKRKHTNIIIGIVAAILFVAATIVCIKVYSIIKKQEALNEKQPTISTEPSVDPMEEEPPVEEPTTIMETQPASSADVVRVLAAKDDLLPGHILTKDDFAIEEIDDIDFKLLSGVNGIYTETDIDGLLGQVMQRYLPAERYISYKDVGDTYEPVNPWAETIKDYETVTLKFEATTESLVDFLCGNIVNLKIETKTKTTTTTPDTDDTKEDEIPSGMKYSQSVVESMILNTYEVQNVKIIDIYNVEEESLFSQYYIIANIPAGLRFDKLKELYGNKDAVNSLIPAAFDILLPAEEAEVLKSLEAEDVTISILSTSPNTTTEVQVQTYTAIQEAGKAIAKLWEYVQKEE